jgi:hypothetical protein
MKYSTKLKDILFILFAVISLFAFQSYAQQNSVSGTVRYSDNFEIVNFGVVKAYTVDGIFLASTPINTDGSYSFPGLDPVQTDLLGFPNLEPEEEDSFIPTYFPDAQVSVNAVMVYPDHPLTGINILVERVVKLEAPGNAFISGKITVNNIPLNDAIIHAKLGQKIVGFGVTSGDGTFEINGIPSGDYILVIHRIGANVVNMNVSVSREGIKNINVNLENNARPQLNFKSEYKLSQNFPNPFNPSTIISYSIPKAGMVNIAVYNSAGQMVNELVNGYMNSGSYNVEFNGSKLSSGVYFYKMVTNGYAETRRMILIK